ncbi:hypothetical protein BC938DRAFT_481449 [Jimgerdemannia flammicorona]|uniref:Uncharacterized protein n=1 Tax=Jimgerdemannia flammicorona TaxID=994334 RepID=A0A433QG66_9FUNG|nr:hypothetical protein BC938DRAFT_481449 [Jimgerdemannia flammicorona]
MFLARSGKSVMILDLSHHSTRGSTKTVNCEKDPTNVRLWAEHSTKVANRALENMLNKDELKNISIHATVRAANSEFKARSDEETSPEYDNECDGAPNYENYKKTHSEMEDDKKWRLTTGTVVEDALFKFGVRCRHEHLAHSFVLDPEDSTYLKEKVFTENELNEIRHFESKELSKMPLDLLKYLNSFDVKTTSELRERVFRPEEMDRNFFRAKDFDRDWIRNTIYNLLQEYEADTLSSDHLELWFLIHIWGFIDKIFSNIEGMEAGRIMQPFVVGKEKY